MTIELERVYHSAAQLISSTPVLTAFAQLPGDPEPVEKPPRAVSAAAMVESWDGENVPETAALHRAIRAAAPFAHWLHTYREDEVGAEFLSRYGYFELVGPEGHFLSGDVRAFVAYWGEGLHYDWHLHEAEELYFVLAGQAAFHAKDTPTQTIGPGGHRLHAQFQPHAMTTGDSPILTLVLWRGAGLGGLPRMGRA